MHSKTLTSERHPVIIPSEFRRPAFTKFGDSLSSAWSISANLGDDGHTVRQSCDPSVPFRFPISFFGQTNRWQLVANARYLLCAAKHPFLALGKEFLNTISGYPSVRFPTGSGRWTGCLRLNFMPSHARDETSTSSTPTLQHRSRNTSKIGPSFSFIAPSPSGVVNALHGLDRIGDKLCELIETSAGSVGDWETDTRSFDGLYREACGWNQGLYEFFNVLWVKWVEGVHIAKRLGGFRKTFGKVRRGIRRKL
jgi:hypothetical protein